MDKVISKHIRPAIFHFQLCVQKLVNRRQLGTQVEKIKGQILNSKVIVANYLCMNGC